MRLINNFIRTKLWRIMLMLVLIAPGVSVAIAQGQGHSIYIPLVTKPGITAQEPYFQPTGDEHRQ